MKTVLTLNTGSFYFLSSVNLVRGTPVEVDLTKLSDSELKGLKAYITAGSITSKDDITAFNEPKDAEAIKQKEATKAEPKKEEVKEEKAKPKEDAKEEDKQSETKEETEGPYSKLVKRELKEELEKRGITTDATRNEDLVKLLEEDDAKKK